MTLNDLTVPFDVSERSTLLADWVWLIGPSKLPILVTAAGDAFVQDGDNGTVHFLEVSTGQVSKVADDIDQFKTCLSDREFVASHFAVEMVEDLRGNGVALSAGEVYTFRQPPVLGGELVFDNVEKADLRVHFSLMGQIHEQVAALPPGTPVSSVRLVQTRAITGRCT